MKLCKLKFNEELTARTLSIVVITQYVITSPIEQNHRPSTINKKKIKKSVRNEMGGDAYIQHDC